jgi:hypothetical protein
MAAVEPVKAVRLYKIGGYNNGNNSVQPQNSPNSFQFNQQAYYQYQAQRNSFINNNNNNIYNRSSVKPSEPVYDDDDEDEEEEEPPKKVDKKEAQVHQIAAHRAEKKEEPPKSNRESTRNSNRDLSSSNLTPKKEGELYSIRDSSRSKETNFF